MLCKFCTYLFIYISYTLYKAYLGELKLLIAFMYLYICSHALQYEGYGLLTIFYLIVFSLAYAEPENEKGSKTR